MKKIENPWKILSSKVVYESPFLKVVEDKVITPEGKEGIHNLVFGGRGNIDGVNVAAINEKNEIFLVKQYRYAYGGFTLELPGGGVALGEKPMQAAQKELGEEAGLRAARWTKYGEIHAATEVLKSKVYMYIAQNLHVEPKKRHQENSMSIIKVPLKEAVELVMTGKIQLASSALGIIMVSRILNSSK